MYGPSNWTGALLLNGRESTGQDISEVKRQSEVTCGGTRVRSISDQMGGSRLGTRALHSRPDRIWAWRLIYALGSAGVLSRGVGLRGFESHPPHQMSYPVVCRSTFLKPFGVEVACALYLQRWLL